MVDKEKAFSMWYSGSTLKSIGDLYGVSKQRIWQIVKARYYELPEIEEYEHVPTMVRPNKSEIYVGTILSQMGYRFEHMPCLYPYDLTVGKSKVEVKHRSKTNKGRYIFKELYSREEVDFFVFVCGDLGPQTKHYIVPACVVNSYINIPDEPIYTPTKMFEKRYRDAWHKLDDPSSSSPDSNDYLRVL